MNFSKATCLLLVQTLSLILGQVSGMAQVNDNYVELPEDESDEVETNPDFVAQESQEIPEAFLKQFVLIKTPYGYALAKASPPNEMVRVQRSRQQAEKNFQLRVRKADRAPYNSNFQLRVRKNGQVDWQSTIVFPQIDEISKEFLILHGQKLSNFDVDALGAAAANNWSVLQEIRDRRRAAANYSNNNFQLRVRKSQERNTRGSAGKNFQLRV